MIYVKRSFNINDLHKFSVIFYSLNIYTENGIFIVNVPIYLQHRAFLYHEDPLPPTIIGVGCTVLSCHYCLAITSESLTGYKRKMSLSLTSGPAHSLNGCRCIDCPSFQPPSWSWGPIEQDYEKDVYRPEGRHSKGEKYFSNTEY